MSETIIKLKFWFYQHSWWLLVIATILIIFWIISSQKDSVQIVAVAGTAISSIHFIQKQKLNELQLFRELFKDFNTKYDSLNDILMAIPRNNPIEKGSDSYAKLIDYFNLCGEEYLYYTKGYIDPVVWKAWHKGMQEHIGNPAIGKIWQEEKSKDSYYGLQL